MKSETRSAIESILAMDATIKPGTRSTAIALLDGDVMPTIDINSQQLLSREKVSIILGKSLPTIDRYCQQNILTRICVGPSGRSIGITRASVDKLLATIAKGATNVR